MYRSLHGAAHAIHLYRNAFATYAPFAMYYFPEPALESDGVITMLHRCPPVHDTQPVRANSRRLSLRAVVLAAFVALGITLGYTAKSPAPALAQTAGTLEVILHSAFVGLHTTSLERPTFRLFDPDGALKIEREGIGPRPADGHWTIQLQLAPDVLPVLIEPGDRVEVTVGGAVSSVTVPVLTATTDTETDTVSGHVLGAGTVFLLLHRDPALFDDNLNPDAIIGLSAADGTYTVPVGDSFDIRPGTWGELAIADESGNIFAVPFAPPFARVLVGSHLVGIRVDGPLRPTIALMDEFGSELSRAGEPIPFGNGQFLVALARSGSFEGGFLPRPGEQLGIVIDEEIVASETVTWRAATVDPEASEVRGHGPAGARLSVDVFPDGPDMPSTGVRYSSVGEDGTWSEHFPGLSLDTGSEATAEVWAGGPFVHQLTGKIPFLELELFGNSLSGLLEGRGEVEIIHTPVGGGAETRRSVLAQVTGEFEATLFNRGDEVPIGSGDQVEIRSETGEVRTLIVPEMTALAVPDRRGLRGSVPPGSQVAASLYAFEPDIFGVEQFERPSTVVETVADDAGAFVVRCPDADAECGARYGFITVRDGVDSYTLRWIDQPSFGVAVSRSNAFGFVSSGAPVRVSGGGLEEPRVAVSHPMPYGRLPGWEILLNDIHPGGLPLDALFKITVDGVTREILVPDFEWTADTRTNTVFGLTSLTLRPIVVIAYSNGDMSRPPAGVATAAIDAAGNWIVRFTDFNLLPGDDIEMYVLEADHFLQWHQTGVNGPDEATRVPPTPTAAPTAVSSPAPSAEPSAESKPFVFLPLVRR